MGPKVSPQSEATWTLLCLNTRGLPIDSDAEERAHKLVKYVVQKDYDVLCLQEVFHEDARKAWVEGLRDSYKHIIEKTDQSLQNMNSMLFFVKEDSGLVVASKFPITWEGFVPWEKQSGPDWAANKGILGFHIDLSSRQPGASAFIVNTHMDSDAPWIKGMDADKDEPLRTRQLEQIRDFAACHEHDSFLVVGDYNIIGDKTDEYGKMLSRIGSKASNGKPATKPRDLYRSMHPDATKEPGFTWDPTINKLAASNSEANKTGADLQERLDYIVELDGKTTCHSCELFLTGPDKDSQLSDHFGVLAVLGCDGKKNVPGDISAMKGKNISGGCCTIM